MGSVSEEVGRGWEGGGALVGGGRGRRGGRREVVSKGVSKLVGENDVDV